MSNEKLKKKVSSPRCVTGVPSEVSTAHDRLLLETTQALPTTLRHVMDYVTNLEQTNELMIYLYILHIDPSCNVEDDFCALRSKGCLLRIWNILPPRPGKVGRNRAPGFGLNRRRSYKRDSPPLITP